MASRGPSSFAVSDLLLRAANLHPDRGIRYATPNAQQFVSYPQLLEQALRILSGLRARGCGAGSKVVLVLEQPLDFLPAFWACLLGGLTPCPLAPIRHDAERWAQQLAHVNRLLEQPLLVTTASLMSEVAGINAADLATLYSAAPHRRVHDALTDDAAFLVLTSGSTGNAKAVTLTHGNLLASVAGKNHFQKLTAADTTLNWISFDHVAAIIEAHLLPLYAGANQLHVDSASILADPLSYLRLIDEHRVSMSFAPNFLFGQINAAVSDASKLRLDLSCLRHIISGGEAIVAQTGRKFLEHFAPFGLKPTVLWPAFGMSECCAGSVYSQRFADEDPSQEFASLGLPIPGLQMRVVDEHGAVMGDGETGELQLRGPMVFTGYFNNEVATRAAFTDDHWFRTGDLGRLLDGALHLAGRSKDSIIVSGANYFSHELETVLGTLEGIDPSFIASFPIRPKGADTEQLVIACAPTFPLRDQARLYQLMIGIRNTTVSLWGFRPALILPLPSHAFPKTSLGKTLRTVLRQKLAAGDFAEHQNRAAEVMRQFQGAYVAPVSTAEITVASIFARMFKLDRVSATANFFDLGGSSLQIVELKLAIEHGFHVDVPVVALLQNPTVRELAAHLTSGTSSPSTYDPVVPLQVTGDKTPVWCVHAGSGEVLVFVSLAAYFTNERPFYALRARGFDERDEYFESFDEMVTTYVAGIRRRQPRGPYALAGYSYGAPVAFEIAKRLEADGERVAFVGSIDGSPTIGSIMARLDRIDSAVILAFFLSLVDRQQMAALPGVLRGSVEDFCSYIYGQASTARLVELGLALEQFRKWVDLSHALIGIGEPYVPSGTVESVTVFYAEPLAGTLEDWRRDLQQWDSFTRTPTRHLQVDGEHHTLFTSKPVAVLQSLLRAELERAFSQPQGNSHDGTATFG